MAEPKWMTVGRSYLGEKEIPGSKHNHKIVQWFKDSGYGGIKDDETAWCAAYVNAVLKEAGVKGSGSVAARSFLQWGEKLKTPKLGCIVVFWRVKKDGWQGHVGFYAGETKTQIKLLGGNQPDSVSIKNFPKSRLLGYRWPSGVAVRPKVAPTIPAEVPIPVERPPLEPAVVLMVGMGPDARVKALQEELTRLNYHPGGHDGIFGNLTRDMVMAFQADNGLKTDGMVGAATWAAFEGAAPRPLMEERKTDTLDDLAGKGSVIAKEAVKGEKNAWAMIVGGVTLVVGKITEFGSALVGLPLDIFREGFDVWGPWLFGSVIVLAGVFWLFNAQRVGEQRVADHQDAKTL